LTVPKATLEGAVLAESEHTVVAEGNRYFPPASVNGEYRGESDARKIHPRKGEAGYYSVENPVAFYCGRVRIRGLGDTALRSRAGTGHARTGRAKPLTNPAVERRREVSLRSGVRRLLMDERQQDRAGDAAREMAAATRDSYKAVVERAFAVRESNQRLTRTFFEEGLEVLHDHAEMNRRAMETLSRQAREQREALRELSRESLDAYDGFVDSLSAYHDEVSGGRDE
jgi:2-oxoglutarate dehydrogenase complex dehydrogenase (E1) component-like enzyme